MTYVEFSRPPTSADLAGLTRAERALPLTETDIDLGHPSATTWLHISSKPAVPWGREPTHF